MSASSQEHGPALNVYSAVGRTLNLYQLDPESAGLSLRAHVQFDENVQYAWHHPSLPILYVGTASSGPRQASLHNYLSAWKISQDGSLQALGSRRPLPARPVHLCVHPSGRFLLAAHNYGGGALTVYSLDEDGAIGEPVVQREPQYFGIYPHQVMVMPGGDYALIVDRGNPPKEGTGEEPGALRTYRMKEGQLSAGQVVAPDGGFGFGPRHVDFHPSGKWLYASDERFNRLHVFGLNAGKIDPVRLQNLPTLANPDSVAARQLGGPIHIHPAGKAVYVANRADGTLDRQGRKIFGGGENNIAVFEIDPVSGNARIVQHADTESFHVRTFAVDPAGRFLIAASVRPLETEHGRVGASLSVFRMDGARLNLVNRIEVDTPDGALQYWMGLAENRSEE
ncbi:beta-propeller fold lactonase family protein [Bordetella sp. N]|uniref:lactonase family protein n=1 Tax=Bordetella sp. N TaxID=1746199 RepID=UPI00070FDB8E|nr:beta-propeller fold lactonase family protein [Bordetella sp. N]ALM84242.1 hypothetical protein ASB57_15800 [Bordetella sp. N]